MNIEKRILIRVDRTKLTDADKWIYQSKLIVKVTENLESLTLELQHKNRIPLYGKNSVTGIEMVKPRLYSETDDTKMQQYGL